MWANGWISYRVALIGDTVRLGVNQTEVNSLQRRGQ
jgi:hypothetical protein